MPKIRDEAGWATTFRKQVRKLGSGWTVRRTSRTNKVSLELRTPGQKRQEIVLPYKWEENTATEGDCYTRIRNIYALTLEGHDLKRAAEIADGKAPKIERDWFGAAERFKVQKMQHGKTVKPVTWEKGYEPVVSDAVDLLMADKATNPEDLIDRCIEKWPPGCRTRQERARNLVQFLKHCVYREGFPSSWLPSSDLKDHIGQKPTNAISQKGDPITDQQILNLLASFPEDSTGLRWANCIKLTAELGLRPIELLHLSVRTDNKTKKPYWWCSYRKRAGGGTTEPRRLHPLPLVSDEGEVQQWNLMALWQANLIDLPSLKNGKGASEAIKTYLNRRKNWLSLKEELKAKDERAVPYSFRHSYSVRGHQRGIDNGSMSNAMGHSIETHCRSYPWATDSGTLTAFEKANKSLAIAA